MPPYQPEEFALPAGDAAFTMLLDVVRTRYPRFVACDPLARRLQSAWVEVNDGDVPGRRRVSVFATAPDRIGIVVERSWLRQGVDGSPAWTPAEGDRVAERELAAAVRDAFLASVSRSP